MNQDTQVQPTPLLFADYDKRVMALSTSIGYSLGETGDFTLTVAAFSPYKTVLHMFTSADKYDLDAPTSLVSQVALTPQEMETLITAYQAYQREQHAQAASSSEMQSDPFLPDVPDD